MSYEEIVKQWQSYNISKESDIDKYLHSFRVLFAYNSGKIKTVKSIITIQGKFSRTEK